MFGSQCEKQQDGRSNETVHHAIKEQQDMTVQNPQLQTAKKIMKISDIQRDRVARLDKRHRQNRGKED